MIHKYKCTYIHQELFNILVEDNHIKYDFYPI